MVSICIHKVSAVQGAVQKKSSCKRIAVRSFSLRGSSVPQLVLSPLLFSQVTGAASHGQPTYRLKEG